MKTIKFKTFKMALLTLLVVALGCERELDDNAPLAGFSTTGDIFNDTPVSLGEDFYFPYGNSNFEVINFQGTDTYQGNASIEINVPNADNVNGNYAGAIFRVDGAGRDLSGFDALTFYAKASQGITLDQIGFGEDFLENNYVTSITNLSIGTGWEKYIIPIPDASKLTEERGMFRYSAGTQSTGGFGYTIWLDEIKFEKLGTIAQPRPAIANGNDIVVDTFAGASVIINGFTETFNLANGNNQTVQVAPGYYTFSSSDPSVASVNAAGEVTILTNGTTVITATLNNMDAEGSVTINSVGSFEFAPTPTRDPNNVTSIFSDHYTSIPVDFFNGYWEPFQTTLSADFAVNGDNILSYTNFNFVGHQFSSPTVDATVQSNLHVNMFIPADIPADLDFLITIKDFGADQADGGGDDTIQQAFFYANDFQANTWATLEIPITIANRNNIGQIIYENINNPTTSSIENFYLDNIYFYQN